MGLWAGVGYYKCRDAVASESNLVVPSWLLFPPAFPPRFPPPRFPRLSHHLFPSRCFPDFPLFAPSVKNPFCIHYPTGVESPTVPRILGTLDHWQKYPILQQSFTTMEKPPVTSLQTSNHPLTDCNQPLPYLS